MFPLKSFRPQLIEQKLVLFQDYSWKCNFKVCVKWGNLLFYHMKAISFLGMVFGETSDLVFSIWTRSVGAWEGEERDAALCSRASTDKGLVVNDTFTAKFTPEWQQQVHLGLPDTCAQGSRILRPDDQGGKPGSS